MNGDQAERWARSSATAGAVVCAMLAAMAGATKAPLGVIELLFLFAPLVIVPLGPELGRVLAPAEPHRGEEAARVLQPLAAGLAVASFWFSPGWTAGALVAPWGMVGGLMAVAGLWSLLKATGRSLVAVAANVGRMELAVASAWLLVSRLGIRFLGFREPLLLLTAVHFHYTGFATALLAAAAAAFAQRCGRSARPAAWWRCSSGCFPFSWRQGSCSHQSSNWPQPSPSQPAWWDRPACSSGSAKMCAAARHADCFRFRPWR
jgi:hypothetical protein